MKILKFGKGLHASVPIYIDNADGVADDDNHNGIPDCNELDFDGDGVNRAEAVPWDAFPLDPKEWKDTDGDGIGDNADSDDNDGLIDVAGQPTGPEPPQARPGT